MISGCAFFLGASGFRGEGFFMVFVSLDGLNEGDTSDDDVPVVDILSGLNKVSPEIPSSFVGPLKLLFPVCAFSLNGLKEGEVFPDIPSGFVGLLELLFSVRAVSLDGIEEGDTSGVVLGTVIDLFFGFVVSCGGLEEGDTSNDASDVVVDIDSAFTIVFPEFPSRFACVLE